MPNLKPVKKLTLKNYTIELPYEVMIDYNNRDVLMIAELLAKQIVKLKEEMNVKLNSNNTR